MHALRLSLPVLLLTAAALCAQRTTHFVWILDGGDQANPTPVLRIYDPEGTELSNLSVPGSGPTRAMDAGPDGTIYVCRGNEVRKLDRMGMDTGVVLTASSGNAPAQDVLPLLNGEIWVSWGTNATNSSIARYDSSGSLLASFTDPLLDHPRRLAGDPADGTRVFIANRSQDELLVFDDLPGSPTFTQASTLSMGSIGPVGLAYDATRDAVWVSGDWGQTQQIGFVDVSSLPGTFTAAIDYGAGVPGLAAPSGLLFDRFRRLWVAGRNRNGGVAGAYIFEASLGSSPVFITSFPSSGPAPLNVLDVAAQPAAVTLTVPQDTNGDNVLVADMTNMLSLDAPAFAGSFYLTALSLQWPQSCPPSYIPGVLDPLMTFPVPETRGIPANLDWIFWLTLGVPDPGAMGLLPAPTPSLPGRPDLIPGISNIADAGILVDDFRGFLDPTGHADATVQMPALPASLDGMVDFSLIWVTLSSATLQGFGLITDPVCLTLRVP